MKQGFTIVELLIAVIVIAILAALTYVGYNGIRVAAMSAAAQSELDSIATKMELEHINTGSYPTTLPESGGSGTNGSGSTTTNPSDDITLTLKWSGKFTTYGSLTPVQNGVLMAQTCQDLIDEGLGRGTNQGGQVQNYITGCGNWNHGSMQVTGWNSRVWPTPVTSAQLLAYADAFTSSDTWNASQVPVVKNFYRQLVQRQTDQGGVFPVTSFWDSWATPQNGGVILQPLPANPQTKESYCIEATSESSPGKVWHIDEGGGIKEGPCS